MTLLKKALAQNEAPQKIFNGEEYTLQPVQLFRMLTKAAEIGANQALEKCGNISLVISKQEAYAMFHNNRPAVDRAMRDGSLKTVKKGGKTSNVYIVRAEFEKWVLKDELI